MRRNILARLATGPAPAGALADTFGSISWLAVSLHLRALREARPAHADARGRQQVYTASAAPLDEVMYW